MSAHHSPGIYARYAWHFQGRAAILFGIWAGIAIHAEYILIKILGGTPQHVALFMSVGSAAMLMGLISGPIMQGRSKRPFFLIAGAGGRIGLLVMAFAETPDAYIAGFSIFAISDAFLIPALTTFYQANYPPRWRGRYFAASTRRTVLVLIAVSILAGRWLQADPQAFRWLLALAAVSGAGGWWLMARVRNRRNFPRRRNMMTVVAVLPDSIAESVVHGRSGAPVAGVGEIKRGNPFLAVFRLFARDRRFLRFELQFMCYGMAFISLNAVIPTYLTEQYTITFDQIAWARGLIFHGMLAVGVPLVARFLGTRSPMVVCVVAFSGLGLTQLLILFSPLIDRELAALPALAGLYDLTGGVLVLYGAFFCFGLAMSGVHVVWNLASIYFAGDEEPTAYQGGHTLMVGIRGVIAPFLGVWVATTFSPAVAFISGVVLFALGAATMGWMAWQEAHPKLPLIVEPIPIPIPIDEFTRQPRSDSRRHQRV